MPKELIEPHQQFVLSGEVFLGSIHLFSNFFFFGACNKKRKIALQIIIIAKECRSI